MDDNVHDFDGEFDDIPADDLCDDTIKETDVPCGPLDAEDWMIIGPMSEEEAWRIWERKWIERNSIPF